MHAVQPHRARAPYQAQDPTSLRFRAAEASDAQACAPLMFASGVREFRFFLGESAATCIEFLQFAFASKHGRFSYRRHRVAVTTDDAVVAVLAVHNGRTIWFDDPHVAFMLLLFFGVRRTVGMLMRGLVLESELPAPKSPQTLIAHCATHENVRSTGVFTALFMDAMRAGLAHDDGDREIVLDVLVSNTRAYELYKRLGFVALPRRGALSRRLPRELESVRMRLMRHV